MLIDAEDAVLEIEREILKPHYRSVYAVRNSLEAVRLLGVEQFDLIVSDWKTKGDFAGQEFYDWIRRFRPELATRLIFTLSGADSLEGVSVEIQSSCLFLRKPFHGEEFLGAVQDTLRAPDVSELKR